MNITTKSELETRKIGKKIGMRLKRGVLLLKGPLGAGKTTFVRGIAKGLGVKSRILSPTFTIEREHRSKRGALYHFDFYRLKKRDSIIAARIAEILDREDGLIAIEWPEKMKLKASFFPGAKLVRFKITGENKRIISI